MSNTTIKINVPSIISANTYFWTPAGNADARRRNETRKHDEVSGFLSAIKADELQNVTVSFHYRESCNNVYKSFEVIRNGKKSNIRGLNAELKKQHNIELVF